MVDLVGVGELEVAERHPLAGEERPGVPGAAARQHRHVPRDPEGHDVASRGAASGTSTSYGGATASGQGLPPTAASVWVTARCRVIPVNTGGLSTRDIT
ncbi:MAG: hypothetical protein DIU60_007180 [Actinomycetes bacterium]